MADSEMLNAARAEVKKLEAELAATPAYQKLQLAKKVVEMYERLDGNAPSKTLRNPAPPHISGSKASMIQSVAIDFLRRKGSRATSGELLKAMDAAGVSIGGQEPNKALSAYLSGSKAFNNVRESGGYGLTEWGSSPGPTTSN